MLRKLRNGIADSIACVVDRIPGLLPFFITIGKWTLFLPLVRTIYLRAVRTLCERWHLKNKQFRSVVVGPHSFVYDVSDFTIASLFFYGLTFEPETVQFLSKTLKVGNTVVDIGANRGYISILAAQSVKPAGRIYSFEPNPKIFEGLKEHIRLNHLEHCVELSSLAMSNGESDNAVFYVSNLAENSGLSSLKPDANLLRENHLNVENTIRIRTTTFDHWIEQQGITKPIDLVKIDVEGAEQMVLDGAIDTLKFNPPTYWIVETAPKNPLVEWMKQFGYSVSILDETPNLVNALFTHATANVNSIAKVPDTK